MRKIKITIIHNSLLTVIKSAIRIIEIYWIVRESAQYIGSSFASAFRPRSKIEQ